MTTQSVVQIDETGWPILVLKFGGALSTDDVDVYNGALEKALDREVPFGAVMVASPAYMDSGRNPEVANKTMKWLKEQKPRLAEWCVGIATVIAEDARRAEYAQVAEKQGEKVYGCPLRTFATLEDAQEWVQALLAATP